METQIETLDSVVAACVKSSPEVRRWISQLHGAGDMVYATDGWMAIAVPADMLEHSYGPVADYPENALIAFFDGIGTDTIETVPVDALREAVARWEVVPAYKMIDCPECEGWGVTLEEDCAKCHTYGEVPDGDPIGTRLDTEPYDCIVLLGARFNPNLIRRICVLAEALGFDELRVHRRPTPKDYGKLQPGEKGHPCAFGWSLGQVRGLTMPFAPTREEDERMVNAAQTVHVSN